MIELQHYKPHPDKPGYLTFDHNTTIRDVYRQCDAALTEAGLIGEMEYFDIFAGYQRAKADWPASRWVACFPVEGGSEGHYVHVEAIGLFDRQQLKKGLWHQTDERELLLVGKTFMGLEHAIQIANVLTRAFYGQPDRRPV